MQFHVLEDSRTSENQKGEKKFHVKDLETLSEVDGTWGRREE